MFVTVNHNLDKHRTNSNLCDLLASGCCSCDRGFGTCPLPKHPRKRQNGRKQHILRFKGAAAMKFRTYLICVASFTVYAGAALAQAPTASATDPIYACTAIPDDAARLACFDDAVGALQTRESAGQIQTIDVAQIEAIERDTFGFSMPSLPAIFNRSANAESNAPQREDITEITVAIKSARSQGVTGRVIVVLENGQTWEQIDTTTVNSSTLRKAKEARVKKAALGSFLLSIDGARSFRAKRIN